MMQRSSAILWTQCGLGSPSSRVFDLRYGGVSRACAQVVVEPTQVVTLEGIRSVKSAPALMTVHGQDSERKDSWPAVDLDELEVTHGFGISSISFCPRGNAHESLLFARLCMSRVGSVNKA